MVGFKHHAAGALLVVAASAGRSQTSSSEGKFEEINTYSAVTTTYLSPTAVASYPSDGEVDQDECEPDEYGYSIGGSGSGHPSGSLSSYPTDLPFDDLSDSSSDYPLSSWVGGYTTRTQYRTRTYTVTACDTTVSNCPVGSITSVVETTTTVRPVTEAYPAGGESKPYPTDNYGGHSDFPTNGAPNDAYGHESATSSTSASPRYGASTTKGYSISATKPELAGVTSAHAIAGANSYGLSGAVAVAALVAFIF